MSKYKTEQKKKEDIQKPPSVEEQFAQFFNQLISNAVLQHEGIKQASVEVIKNLGQRLAQAMMTIRSLEKRVTELQGKNKK